MMKSLFPIFCLLVCPLMFVACGSKTKTDDKQMYQISSIEYDSLKGQSVIVSADRMISAYNGRILSNSQRAGFYPGKAYRVILYFGSGDCSTCALQQFYQWDGMMDHIGRDHVEYFYILRPDGNSELNLLVDALNQSYFSLPVLFDERGLFEQENVSLGLLGSSVGFLTDSDGKILVAGNPAADGGQFTRAVKRIVNQ